MAHGWDSYFPNLPPRSSDPRSLRRTSESDRPLPQHIGNFIGHHDFSGAVGSREVPLPNTNFNANYCRTTSFETPRSDCVYNRYYERQWQPDRQQMGRDYPQRYRSRDFPNYASNQLPTSGSHHSSFVPDFHRPKQERDMRAMSYRGNYSATSNYSDTDSREARPSCKFTRSNFFPRPKTDIVSNESSAKLAFSTTGNRNTQAERLCPNMSETSSFSVKGYREQNHSSATSSDVSTTGNEYDGNEDAFHDQKQKVDVDRDLAEAAYSDFQMTEKCFEDGNCQHPMDKEEEELLKSTAPGTFDNKQNYMDDHVEKINPNEAFKNPDSTDDQDTIVNENDLEKSQVLESLWEKSGSLDDELFDEKTSLIPNSSICKDEMMKTDQHERGIQKDASHPLVMNESSSSDDNDEQSESISSSNNYDIEFNLQLPEPKSCESLGRMSDDHSRDSNAGTNISQETQKDEESLSAAVEEKSTFSQDTDCCRPSETRDHSSEETSDHLKKDVASNVLLASPSSGTHKYLQKSKDLTRAEKSNLLSQDPDCIGPSANNNGILKNSANNYKQDLIHADSCLQPSSSGPDIDPSVEMESTQEKTTPILSQDSCTSNATVDSFCNDLGEEKHKCIESHPDSILNNLGTDLDPVQENGSPPERKTPNSPPRQNSSPIVTSDNISVDINDTVSQAEIVIKRNSSGTDLHTDQEMGTAPDEEAPNSSSSQEFSPSVIHDNPSNDNGDIVNCSEFLHKNVLNTDLFPFHSKEWESPLESTNAISRTDPKCITRAMITDSNTQRDFSDLKSCSQPSAAIDVNSLLDEESINQEEITNSAFYPDPPHSINESFPSQEQTEQADFAEDAKDSHEKLDLSAKALSELGLLYGEPLSGDESSCGAVETCDDSHQLQKTPVTRPEKDPMDQLERPEPQLTFSVNMRPFLHPVVILMNMESTNCISNTYNCANCLHTANSVDDLIEHHYSCHPMPSYQFCKTCNVYLKKNEQEEQHLCGQIIPPKKNNCGPYKCSRCGLLFSRILQYIRHMRDHTGRTPYQCKGCGFYFAQSSSLNHHKRVPGRCKQSLAAKKTDTVDIKTKTPTQKYVAQSTSYENMKQCYVRLIDISKTNVCNFCGKSFSSAKKTKKHIYNVHKKKNMAVLSYQSETGALYKCPLCPRHFKYSYNRARHLRFCVRNAIYGGKKKVGDKYVCPLCKAAFTATSNRYRHVKLTCLRETLNRLAREKLRLRQKCMKEKDQKPQSKEYVWLTQGKEGEAKKQGTQVSTAPIIQYKCSHCPAIFFHPSGKYRHMKKHELFKRTGKIIRYRKSAVSKPASPGGTMTEESTDTTKEFPIPTQSCRFCGLNFHVLSSLKRHERGHRGDRPYRCLECRKGFKKRTHLIGHRVVHQKRIQCTVCRKILPTIGELIQHRSSHLKKGMLQCPECQAQFQYPVYLLRHLQTHKNKDKKTKKPEDETQIKPQQSSETLKEKDRPKLLQCSLCKETFDDAQILRKHSLMHISGSSNDCPFCKKRFTTRHSLMRHMVKHTGDKPFSCADCGRQFYRSVYLKVHSETCTHAKNEQPIEANSSNPIKNKRYWCTICPRRFWTLSRLDMHLNAHKNKSLHLCTKCGQYFGVNMISRHKLVCVKTKEIPSDDKSTESNSTQVSQNVQETSEHSNASKMLKLKCPYCPKRFRYRSLLLRHIVSHTGVQPFRCMHCGHRFRSQTLCLKHEASCDAGSKMDQPELKINAEADLESQKLLPEGEAELKCKFCTKTFLKARSLRHHILTHNEVKPYRCKACDSCFSRYDHLKVHQALCKSKKTRLEVRIPKICLEDVGKGWQSKFNLKPLDEQESFDCKVCLKSFPTENKLSRHTTMFHTVKPFNCSRCGSAFSHEKTLKQHRRTKRCKKARTESYTPLQQDETNQPTDKIVKQLDGIRKKILVKIQPLFNKDLKFVCSYCPRAFKNSWQLNVHNRLHTGERPYSCEHCGERFIRSDYLLRHNSKCKDKTQLSNALCDRCGGFFSEKQLEIHKKTCILGSCSPTVSKSSQSSTQPPPKGFSCAYCSSRFLIFSQLQEHFLSTHKLETGAPPVSTAPLQQLLSNIPNIKEEPVDESYGKAPGNDGDVSKPDMAPTTSDPLVCQKCNMCFINRAGLTGHQRAHETRTPFACKYCNRGFWNKTQHRNHFRKCRIVSQRLDVPVKAEIDYAFNDSKSKKDLETAATTTASADNLQTNFPCKEEPEENSTQASYGNVDQSSNSSTEKKAVQYQCSECDKSFTDGLLLISHLEDHGREEQEKKCNKCSKCGRMFSNQGNLRRHMKLHMVHQRYFCSLCPKVCSTLSELEKHKAGHESNKPFACKLCRQSFWTRLALCEHYSGEHGDEIFHCQWCSKVYASKKSLSRHYKKWHPKELSQLRSAHLQRGSVDQQSGSYVSTNGDSDEDLNLDSDSNSDSAPYFPCHVCGKTFPTSESLEDHQLCHLGKKPHECAECGKCFFQASQLQQHQRMHKSEFQCQTCGRGFVSLFALRNHKHSHGKSRPFRCSKCHLGFAGPTQLAEHMSTHREESFPCDICNKIFQCKSSRAEHRKSHSTSNEGTPPSVSKGEHEQPKSVFGYTTEFKYRCGICSERFRNPEQLSEHGCLEARERPYTCTECNKHFLHASHLNKHRNTHHQAWSDREYPCNQCNSSFSSSQYFLSHLKTHEGTATVIGWERDSSDGFICPVCHQCFANATELIHHFPIHPDCAPEREKAEHDTTEGELEEQEVFHPTAPAEYECGKCGGRFLGKEALHHHHCSLQQLEVAENTYFDPADVSPGNEVAGDEEDVDVTGEDLYRCHECSMQFFSKSSLLEHQNDQHPNNWKEFKCETCGKTFAKKRYLRKHELRQHGPKEHTATTANLGKKFKCIHCRGKFSTAQDLSNHMRLHAENQAGEYRCDMCYKSFSKRGLLKQHQESHVGEVVYECTECDKAFAFPHLLEEHQRSHTASSE